MDGAVPVGSVQMVLDEATVVLPLAGVIEFDKERARLDRELGKVGKEMAALERKLANGQFRARAPAEVVARDEERLATAGSRLRGLEQSLAEIS